MSNIGDFVEEEKKIAAQVLCPLPLNNPNLSTAIVLLLTIRQLECPP